MTIVKKFEANLLFGLACDIEQYANENRLEITTISVMENGDGYGALVAFKKVKEGVQK